MNEIVLETVQC